MSTVGHIKQSLRSAKHKPDFCLLVPSILPCMRNHGRIVFGLPKDSGTWKLKELQEFARAYNLKWVVFDGCALELVGKSDNPIRKPGCLYTNGIRVIQFFSQSVCPGNHAHAETMGKSARMSTFYTRESASVLMECWYPPLGHRAISS